MLGGLPVRTRSLRRMSRELQQVVDTVTCGRTIVVAGRLVAAMYTHSRARPHRTISSRRRTIVRNAQRSITAATVTFYCFVGHRDRTSRTVVSFFFAGSITQRTPRTYFGRLLEFHITTMIIMSCRVLCVHASGPSEADAYRPRVCVRCTY